LEAVAASKGRRFETEAVFFLFKRSSLFSPPEIEHDLCQRLVIRACACR
jgi:hypothetical protein